MEQDELKQQVARAAIEEIRSELTSTAIIGVGTGTTADRFIDLLGASRAAFKGAVASSERSAKRLRQHGIEVFDLSDVDQIPVYVDGADEITRELDMIKGGGGALTREKIVASAALRFVCIADGSKLVPHLGTFGVPIEVIPMAVRLVANQLAVIGRSFGPSDPRLRMAADGRPYVTDNGNHIIDWHGLAIDQPKSLESVLNGITGIVCNGLFALRGADVLLLARPEGIERYLRGA